MHIYTHIFPHCRKVKKDALLMVTWLGGRKGIRPVKKMGDGGGGHWLVRMEWRPARWSVCLPLLIFPCTAPQSQKVLFWHWLTWVVLEKWP